MKHRLLTVAVNLKIFCHIQESTLNISGSLHPDKNVQLAVLPVREALIVERSTRSPELLFVMRTIKDALYIVV